MRLIPSGPLVIGWVNDFRIEEEQKNPPAHNGVQKNRTPGPLDVDLSDQERNIAEGVLRGQTNQCIADRLGIKEGTVKFHLSNIYRKYHLTSRVQLALQGAALLHRTSAQDLHKPQGQDSHDNT